MTSTSHGDLHGSRGFRLILVLAYAIFALSATARSLVQILTEFTAAPLAFLLSLFAALTYLALALLMARRRVPFTAAMTLIGIELAGVLGVGVLSSAAPQLFPRDSVWSHFGSGYGYVPLVLPLIAGAFLLRQRRSAATRLAA